MDAQLHDVKDWLYQMPGEFIHVNNEDVKWSQTLPFPKVTLEIPDMGAI